MRREHGTRIIVYRYCCPVNHFAQLFSTSVASTISIDCSFFFFPWWPGITKFLHYVQCFLRGAEERHRCRVVYGNAWGSHRWRTEVNAAGGNKESVRERERAWERDCNHIYRCTCRTLISKLASERERRLNTDQLSPAINLIFDVMLRNNSVVL